MKAPKPERGYLALADLSGYTAYLSRSEIEHAPRIAGDLVETVVGRLEPPFRLAKLEGDAAFCWVEDGRADGSLLLDAIEAAYLAFRRRLRSIEAGAACDCTACSAAPALDLKVFLHHGDYLRHRVAGRTELAGRDVIVAHRLLKGATGPRAGVRGYVEVTDAAASAAGLQLDTLGFAPRDRELDDFGTVRTWVLDLEARWHADAAEARLVRPAAAGALGDGDLDATEVVVLADAATVWAHLTRPELRVAWEGPLEIRESPAGGRRGRGTTTTCVTGRLTRLEEVVDWMPFEHLARRVAIPGQPPLDVVVDLEPAAGGTLVRWWAGRIDEPDAVAPAVVGDAGRSEPGGALRRLAEVLERATPVGAAIEGA